MPIQNEDNKPSGDASSPMANSNPVDRNFQRNDKETDVSRTENSEEEEQQEGETSNGSSGPEEKDITA